MSVVSEVNKDIYNLTGAGTAFAFTSKIFAETDIVVIRKDTAGVETTLALTTHYTVNTGPWPTGGTVTTVTNYADGTLLIKSSLPVTQAHIYTINDEFPAKSHEFNLDRAVLLIQETREILSRIPQLKEVSDFSNLTLPELVANKIISVNAAGTAYENRSTVDLSVVTVTAFAETLLDDATAGAMLTTLEITAFVQTLLDDTTAAAFMTTLGITSFVQTLLDDVNAAAFMDTLGITTFAQTILDDANAAAMRTTLSVNSTAETLALIDDLSGVTTPTTARDNLGVEVPETLAFNGGFSVWTRGTNFSVDLGSNVYALPRVITGAGNGTGVGDLAVSRQVHAFGTPSHAGAGRYLLRNSWTAGPTAGEARTGYTDYFTQLEIRIEDARNFAGKTVTVGGWINCGSNQELYLYVSQGMGSSGDNGTASGNTISGTGAGIDHNNTVEESFYRSAEQTTTANTWQYWSFTATLQNLASATLTEGSVISFGVGFDAANLGAGARVDYSNWAIYEGSVGIQEAVYPSRDDRELMAARYWETFQYNLVGVAISTTEIQVAVPHTRRSGTSVAITLLDTSPDFRVGATVRTGSSSTISTSQITTNGSNVTINGFTSLTAGQGVVSANASDILSVESEASGG